MSGYQYVKDLTVESAKQFLAASDACAIIGVAPEFTLSLARHYLETQEAKEKADYFDILVDLARQEAAKAIEKYPQPNYTMLKFSEEAGEVIKAAVHYAESRDTWVHVEEEIVQTLAMLIRFLREGDGVNKIYPPKDMRDAMRGNRDAC